MKNNLARIAAAVALCSASMASQAAVVNLTGWAFGSGNVVDVATPAHKGSAGGFKGSVNFSAAEEAAGFTDILGNGFITYCVEINEHFRLPSGDMTGYVVQSASTYVRSFNGTAFGAATASRLGKLMSYVASNAALVDTAAESTALQLAVWNIVYDADDSLNGGPFKENSVADNFKSTANSLLTASAGAQNKYDVYILSKSGSQDFLLLRELPEPTSLALAFVALGGMGAAARRRKA